MHKNVLSAGVSPRTPHGEFNFGVPLTFGFGGKGQKGGKGVAKKEKRKGRGKEGKRQRSK